MTAIHYHAPRPAVTSSVGQACRAFEICDQQIAIGDVIDLGDPQWKLPPRRLELLFEHGWVSPTEREVTRNPGEASGVPAGWYPQGDGDMRYWDGAQWTEHTSAAQEEA